MSKIILLHPSDEFYGADKVLFEIANALRTEHDVEVWLANDVAYPDAELSRRLKSEGIKVLFVDLPVLRSSYLRFGSMGNIAIRAFRAWRKLRSAAVDVVYINTSALAPVTVIAKLAGIKSILHLHEDLRSPLRQILVMPLVSYGDRIVAVSEAVRAGLPRLVRPKTRIIYNGFSLAEHAQPSVASPKRFLLSSRWNTWKGHAQFLQAWEGAALVNAQLVILGGPPEIGEATDVRALVQGMETRSSIEIVGQTADVDSYLDSCHVVVVPSVLPDPLPTIAIEALAAGRPVMASNIGGLPEIVTHGETGWLIDALDIMQWIENLARVNDAPSGTYSTRARDVFDRRFSVTRFRKEVRDVVSQLLVKYE